MQSLRTTKACAKTFQILLSMEKVFSSQISFNSIYKSNGIIIPNNIYVCILLMNRRKNVLYRFDIVLLEREHINVNTTGGFNG